MPPPTLALFLSLSDLIRETSVGRERQATAVPIAITDFINSVAKRRVVVGLGKCGYFRREGNQPLALAFLPSSDMEDRPPLLSSLPPSVPTSRPPSVASVCPSAFMAAIVDALVECSGEMATEDGGRAVVRRGGTEGGHAAIPTNSRPAKKMQWRCRNRVYSNQFICSICS